MLKLSVATTELKIYLLKILNDNDKRLIIADWKLYLADVCSESIVKSVFCYEKVRRFNCEEVSNSQRCCVEKYEADLSDFFKKKSIRKIKWVTEYIKTWATFLINEFCAIFDGPIKSLFSHVDTSTRQARYRHALSWNSNRSCAPNLSC